ncbi:nostrin-like isoform X1 [Porites lutea]|uniref:nostrin-like isoform X1 n=1 Tax=Porites lutea TaxID=51062 RepID=UPI003CC568F2
MTRFEDAFWEQKGYEELRKLCRQGNEFCREVSSIFNERAKIEQTYAESLSRLAAKAQKTSKDALGTLKSSWESVIIEMQNESEIHRTLGTQLHDEVSKQVKTFVETQVKTRKAVEALVDKAYKSFSDKLNDALKAKRTAYTKAKEAEAMFEQVEEARAGKGGKVLSEKEISKMDVKCKKMTESSFKADKEYRDLYEKTEKARLEWEASMLKCCQTCEKLEEERITHLREMCSLYSNMLAAVIPQLQQNYENVSAEVWKINPSEDVVKAANTRGEPRGPAEQILYDCYEEDLEVPMNYDRRRVGLEAKIQLLSEALEKQKKTRDGITSLFEAYSATPDYCHEEGQQDVATQLTHANAIINSLTASVNKVQGALADLNGQSKPHVWLMTYVQTTKDKQGMLQSVLRIPLDQVTTNIEPAMHDERDNKSDDEFDDFPDTESPGLCRCRALYEYKASQSDELDILPGDIITLTAKLEGGWWQGELHNKTGIFPASYVEEIG